MREMSMLIAVVIGVGLGLLASLRHGFGLGTWDFGLAALISGKLTCYWSRLDQITGAYGLCNLIARFW